ncbi:MAG: hypothetical protein MUF38_06890 [Anaerolineae bacterium]|jgi:hypothetical protein|nr:hypothetical protein [Anaerolineae bacterium]
MFDKIKAFFQRRRVLARLARFISGELTLAARREVTRELDDPAVYAEYRRQRDAVRRFESDLGGVGRSSGQALQRGWGNIASALGSANPSPYRLTSRPSGWRLTVLTAGLAVSLLIPVGLGAGRASASPIPTPPTARIALYNATPASTDDLTSPSDITPDATPGVSTANVSLRATPTAPITASP